jgi:hypothetical protein
MNTKQCTGTGCVQGRWPQHCDCTQTIDLSKVPGRSKPINPHDIIETVRDSLIGDCPEDLDVDLPTDGSQRWIRESLVLGTLIVALLAACAMLWPRGV